jgi:hypothetical protein
MGSRSDWPCFRRRLRDLAQQTVNPSDLKFYLSYVGGLQNLLTLDLGCLPDAKQVVDLSRCCPQLQTLVRPTLVQVSIPAIDKISP